MRYNKNHNKCLVCLTSWNLSFNTSQSIHINFLSKKLSDNDKAQWIVTVITILGHCDTGGEDFSKPIITDVTHSKRNIRNEKKKGYNNKFILTNKTKNQKPFIGRKDMATML